MGRKGKVGCADAVPKTEYAMKQEKVKAVCSEKLRVRFVRAEYVRSRNGRSASTLQTREAEAARRFFLKTLTASHSSKPRVFNVEKNAAYPKAFNELKAEGMIPESCELWQVKPGLCFFSFETAWRALQGYEIMNSMRKGQLQGTAKEDVVGLVAFIARVFGMAA